jgi:glycine/sarcosine N-methyltransferase
VRERWGLGVHAVLDAAAGIGTQALGLAGSGYSVCGSDLSLGALLRARREAAGRRRPLRLAAGDLRALPWRDAAFDLVLACDNSLPHLLGDGEIATALARCRRCLRPGGGLLLSVRDYPPPPPPGTVEVRPYGVRHEGDRRVVAFQLWEWDGPCYDLSLALIETDGDGGATGRRPQAARPKNCGSRASSWRRTSKTVALVIMTVPMPASG